MIKILQENDSDIKDLKDVIDMKFKDGEFDDMKKYQQILKDEYNIVYYPIDKEKLVRNKINKFKDLKKDNYLDYIEYSKAEYLLKTIDINLIIIKIGEPGEKFRYYTIDNNIYINMNYSDNVDIYEKNGEYYILTSSTIHEIGHCFANIFDLNLIQIESAQIENASQDYFLERKREIFADNFMNYFIEPNYLKIGWKNVYDEIDNLIPTNWKRNIETFIK